MRTNGGGQGFYAQRATRSVPGKYEGRLYLPTEESFDPSTDSG